MRPRDGRQSTDARTQRAALGRFVWPAVLLVVVIALGTFAAATTTERDGDAPSMGAAVAAAATTTLPAASPPSTPAPSTPSTSTVPETTTATTVAAFDVGGILEGREWELDAWVDDDGAAAVPRGVRDSTIQFDGGVATLDTSCNTGSVDYSIRADQVTFRSLVLTELACDGLADGVERSIVDVLDGTTTVSFAAGVLFIDRDDRRLVYLAERRD